MFVKLPPILHIHLRRFIVVKDSDSVVKYNGRFEFPEKLSLDDFLMWPDDTPAEYTLYAVVAHSGFSRNGSYFAFINVGGNGQVYIRIVFVALFTYSAFMS